MEVGEFLSELAEASGVSGHEGPVQRIVRRELANYADEVFLTKLGSVVGVLHSRSSRTSARRRAADKPAPRLLLEAHMDEIGLMVTSIDHGFVRFTQIGGYDVRVLPSQDVVVHGVDELPGVIGSRPPHVLRPEERGRSTQMADLFIDVGLPEARVRELVTVGDVITLDRKVTALRNGCLIGKGFDDRAGVAVVVETLRLLRESPPQWDVYAVANVQEEAGAWYVGASTSAFLIHPDAAVALDVSHADQPGVDQVNQVPLDKGPGIARGPNIHPLMHERLVQTARAQEIPHRVTTYGGPTGTDAWVMQIVGEGIPTGLIDLPLRYMHSSVEMLSLSDLGRASRLMAAFAVSLDEKFYREIKGPPAVQLGKPAAAAPRLKKRRKG